MSDPGANGAAHAVPEQPPRFSTAEDVNPPLPGEPGYEDYFARRVEWMRYLDRQRVEAPEASLAFTPYYDGGLGRRVTPEDLPPPVEPSAETAPGAAGAEASVAPNDTAPEAPRPWQRTGAANGEYFARIHGDHVRFDHRRGTWLVWSGHWWRPDDVDAVRRLAKETARARYREATTIDDHDERLREAKFAIRSEDRYRLESMLIAARSEPPIADAGDRWDTDPWLLGVDNGVIDLRTGHLRPGRQVDRLTIHIPVSFDPAATCPRWEAFLDEVFRGDADLVDYVWRAIGYSLSGDIREQCLFVCHGGGSNGKSVFLRILRALAGGYAADTPFSTFELHGRASIPNDVAALVGRRLVTASETGEGKRLNEARLKALTGGDAITARFMRGEFFTFEPVLKLWLGVNHKPRVTDDSYGFWRRVRLIPFDRRFTDLDRDDELAGKLSIELPGILAWAVRGAVRWHEEGLRAPAAVTSATETYRAESDPLADFIEACCEQAEGLVVGTTRAYRAYREWASEDGIAGRDVLSHKAFGSRMGERFVAKHRHDGNVYLGVGLAIRGAEPHPPPAR